MAERAMQAPAPSAEIPFVDLRSQYGSLKPAIDAAIAGVLERGDFILGQSVGEFEAAFAAFNERRHCVGVGCGLDALHLTLRALEIGAGDEVILPANTFVACAMAVSAAGARPVLVDCEAASCNIDPRQIEAAITPRTRAIMPVHLYGQAAEMDAIMALAARHGLAVIEDAAQAHGARYRGRPCGGIAQAGCFSFYPSKNLGAYGDGGAVVTDDDALAARLRRLRLYGQRIKYHHAERGMNSCLDSIQAAVLKTKLPHLAYWNARRATHARGYRSVLEGVGDLMLPRESAQATHVYHLYVVQTGARDELRAHLARAGIQTGIHYPVPIHEQEAYRDLGYRSGAFPVAERLAGRILSLPMFPELDQAQIERVGAAIRDFFASRRAR